MDSLLVPYGGPFKIITLNTIIPTLICIVTRVDRYVDGSYIELEQRWRVICRTAVNSLRQQKSFNSLKEELVRNKMMAVITIREVRSSAEKCSHTIALLFEIRAGLHLQYDVLRILSDKYNSCFRGQTVTW